MELYRLPESLVADPLVHRRLKGELILSFGGGLLHGHTYRPLGLDALWSLIGAVASLREPFIFDIKPEMTAWGVMGGFSDHSFCLFDLGNHNIDVFSPSELNIAGASKVTIDDRRYGTFYWVPDRAMLRFEDLVKVGNAALLSEQSYFRCRVGQKYSNWVGDRYVPDASE